MRPVDFFASWNFCSRKSVGGLCVAYDRHTDDHICPFRLARRCTSVRVVLRLAHLVFPVRVVRTSVSGRVSDVPVSTGME